MEDLTDYQLIKEILSGRSDQPFELLYMRYKNQLYGVICSILGDERSSADDVFQQTWMKVLEKLPAYREDGKFSSWLFTIGHNMALDQLRKRKRKLKKEIAIDNEDTPDLPDENSLTAWETLAGDDVAAALETALGQLVPEQREIVILRKNGMSFKEIAVIQNCSINTALARMQYAIKKLKKLLESLE